MFRLGNGGVGIWLPNVVAVAILLRNGALGLPLATPVTFISCLTANLLLGSEIGSSVLYAAANTMTVLLEVVLIRTVFGQRKPAISSARDYVLMLTAGGMVAPACIALALATFTTLTFQWSFAEAFWSWTAGEMLGFSLLLPILILADRSRLASLVERDGLVRFTAVVGGGILVAVMVWGWTEFPFLLIVVPLMIAAVFSRPFAVAVASGSVGVTLVGLVMAGAIRGPGTIEGGLVYGFQLSVGLLAALPFLVSLVMEQVRLDRRRIAESEQRFRRAMEDSAIGVAIVGLDGRIIETNRSFASMLGYTRRELETMTFMQVTHPDDVSIGAETMRKVRAGETTSYQFEKRYIRRDGSPVWARLAGSVIRDSETGTPLYLVSQVEDIDAQKRAKQAIADAETRWNFALASAGQGMWDADMKNGRTVYSSTWEQMLGYDPNGLDGDPYHWLTLVHPDDRERVRQADLAHIAGQTRLFEEEFRMRHKDGHWVWILDRGQIVERDADGTPARAIGTLTDITMRREAEDRLLSYAALLADEKERLRVTLDSIGDAVICTDAAMQVTFMNPVAEKLTGVPEKDALGKPLEEVYAPVDEETGERIATAAAVTALSQRVEHNSRAILSGKDGSRCAIREVVSPIHTEKGEFSGAVIVFQDFTDARALQRRLAHAAAHDSLTGLPNRASLLASLSDLVATPRDGATCDLLLYVDLDNFKTVNDTGGHAAGDQLLRQVAEVIRTAVRPGDVAARLGGDEFAVLLRDCTLSIGETIAAQLVATISRLKFERGTFVCSIGASIGLTEVKRGDFTVDEIISHADAACYQAKANGRGRVIVLDPLAARAGKSLARAS